MIEGKDCIGVGAGAVLRNEEGKFFLHLRGPDSRNEPNKWNIPGGTIEFGETREEGIIREIKEEFNIDIQVIETLGVIDHMIPEEGQHWVTTLFFCNIIGGEFKNMEPHKTTDMGWFSIDEMKNLDLTISTQMRLSELKKRFHT